MSSPSDKVWIFVKGRRSFKWKGSVLCPFHKSRLLLLSKGRCQKLRWANPFWSVTYCKKTVKFMQWTVISLSSILPPSSPSTLLLWHCLLLRAWDSQRSWEVTLTLQFFDLWLLELEKSLTPGIQHYTAGYELKWFFKLGKLGKIPVCTVADYSSQPRSPVQK